MKGARKSLVMRDQAGSVYLLLLAWLTIMSVAMLGVGTQWIVIMKRDREAELLFRGYRMKTAIEAYAADYQTQRAVRPNQYPLTLEQLTKLPKRYLPVVYKDPITGKDFELIKVGPQIQGVRSSSKEKPLNQQDFKNVATYRDIAFQAQAAAVQGCTGTPNPVNPLLQVPCGPAIPGAATPVPGQRPRQFVD